MILSNSNQRTQSGVCQSASRMARFRRQSFAAFLAAALSLGLSGCYGARIRAVNRTVVAPAVLDATLEQLLAHLGTQDAAIQTLTASVDITASTGGEHEGQVKEYPSFAGYIFLRRPTDLHLLMLVPVLRSRALEMTSDGKQFKLYIPSKDRAVEGQDEPSTSSKTGIESLRPYMIRDAMLIPTASPDEFVSLTKSSRILPPPPGKKEAIEEPDYDITILRTVTDHIQETERVIHFGRVTLQPYEQDIYDHEGRIVTTVQYGKYQKFGDLQYPTSLIISRPIDEFKLKLDITKLVINQKLDDEQFVLDIPAGIPTQKM
jgi:outer membrane lipoprotein-sorting protein